MTSFASITVILVDCEIRTHKMRGLICVAVVVAEEERVKSSSLFCFVGVVAVDVVDDVVICIVDIARFNAVTSELKCQQQIKKKTREKQNRISEAVLLIAQLPEKRKKLKIEESKRERKRKEK